MIHFVACQTLLRVRVCIAYFGIRSCAIARAHVRTDEMCNQLMCRGGSYKICDVITIDRCHPIYSVRRTLNTLYRNTFYFHGR